MKKRIVQHVGRDDEQVTRMQLKLLIVDNVVHVTAREKVHLVELVIVWFDVVIVVIHRVFDLEIALGHVCLLYTSSPAHWEKPDTLSSFPRPLHRTMR